MSLASVIDNTSSVLNTREEVSDWLESLKRELICGVVYLANVVILRRCDLLLQSANSFLCRKPLVEEPSLAAGRSQVTADSEADRLQTSLLLSQSL